jgi:hypothetical protein
MLQVAAGLELALPQKRGLLVFLAVGESGGVGVEMRSLELVAVVECGSVA